MLDAAISEARTAQESVMLSALKIERVTGTAPGQYADTQQAVIVYEGKGRLQATNLSTRILVAGEHVHEDGYVAAIPHDAPEIKPDDIVTAVDSTDPQMSTFKFIVQRVENASTFLTCRRFFCTKGT